MLDLNYRLQCRHCGKKSIIKLQMGDFGGDISVRCRHCGEFRQITRKDFLAILGNLNQFKKHIKI